MIENNSNIKYSNNDVAIIGIGLRLPGHSNTPSQLWDNLVCKFDGIVETNERWSDSFNAMGEISSKEAGLLELEEWMLFDPLHFGINPAEAKQIDPQQKLLLKTTWEAFEDASIDPLSLRGSSTSVFVGASSQDYSYMYMDHNEKLVNHNVFNSNLGGFANRISYCFDLRGTSLTVDTACSSSLNAFTLAYKSIISGDCNMSICGGTNLILNPQISKAFSSINITSPTGRCKAFDEKADGFVRAEGVGVLILKKLSLAESDGDQIYAVIRGCNSNVDGNLDKGNFIKPSKAAQSNNVIKAFESTKGSLNYGDVDYCELHATGTPIGDPIEVEAIADVFKSYKSKDNPLLIGSIKSNIGHCEAASGVASLIKCCLMLKNRQFVPNIHFEKPNPNIKFDEWNLSVCTENKEFPKNKLVSVAINSFGITGSNCCVLLSEYRNSSPTSTVNSLSSSKYLIPISANSVNSLNQIKDEIVGNSTLYSNSMNFKDFLYNQLYFKTSELIQRSVFSASSFMDMDADTKFISTNSKISGNILKTNKDQPLVYVMCGQGPQWNKMAMDLYNQEASFKKSMDYLDSALSKYFGYSVLSKLREIKDDDNVLINDPQIAQPNIFMLQVSLLELYKVWGVLPSIIVGHSFGEVSAAYCSGMISLENACEIVYIRSALQSKTSGSGKMLAIGLNEKQFKEQFSTKYPLIEISCYNSPSSIVISGIESEILEISKTLKEKQIFSVLLGSPSAFHSSKQEVIKDEVLDKTKSITSSKPVLPVFSTVTGELFKFEDNQFNSNYIYDNIRKPVLFQQAIENIFKYIESNNLGNRIQFLELSPNPTLVSYIKEMIPVNSDYYQEDSVYIVSPLNKKTKDIEEFRNSISELYCNGYNVNFKCQLSEPTLNDKIQSRKASYVLGRYKWDDDIYYHQSPSIQNYKMNGPTTNQLGFKSEQSPFISYTSYIDVGEEPFRFLKGHQAKGKTLFAGCSYLDNILRCFPNQDITINILEFKSPLILVDGIRQCLSTNIYQSGKSEFRAVFHYKDFKTGKWVLSAQSRFSINKQNKAPKNIDINMCKEICNWVTLSRKELYEAIKEMSQLDLTGPFQSIEEGKFGNNAALVKISLNPPISSFDNQNFFNICILDACFQSLSVYKDHSSLTFFDRILNVEFFSENIPKLAMDREKLKYVYCYTELIERAGDSYLAKVVMMLEDGTPLFISPLVVYTAINPVNNGYTIESPNYSLYTTAKQSKDSPLESLSVKLSSKFNEIIPIPPANILKAMVTTLYTPVKKKYEAITPAGVTSDSIELLISKYFKVSEMDGTPKMNLSKLFFELLKSNASLIQYGSSAALAKVLDEQSIKTINSLTKYLLNDTTTTTTTSIDQLLTGYIPEVKQFKIIKEIISNSILPILNENIVFRILEINCGIGLISNVIMTQINQLIQDNPLSEINIEFTVSDKDNTFASFIKEKLESIIHLNSLQIKILFNTIDFTQDLTEQNFNPSYYDIIIVSSLSDIQDRKSSFEKLYDILYPNGYLVIVDTLYKPKTTNYELETYSQWLSYNCTPAIVPLEWQELLIKELGFKEFISTFNLITVQKLKILEITASESILEIVATYDQIIVFGPNIDAMDPSGDKVATSVMDINEQGTDIYRIPTIEEFEKHVESTPLTEKSIIVFSGALNDITQDNFISITYDYIRINQHLIKTNCKCKHVLVTKLAQLESINGLAASLIGAFRYFCEFPQLNIYSFDFDLDIFEKSLADFRMYSELTNSSKHIQREYIIRDHVVYFERIKQETNLKLKYPSLSYINNKQDLMAKLTSQNLEFKLEAKKPILLDNQVEIQVKAVGINFKDHLIYRGLVSKESTINRNGDIHNPELGFECSGIITRVGSKVSKFKVGDQVLGACFSSAASHVIDNEERFILKPSNLSFVEAASIPVVYLTAYFSLFYQGNLSIENQDIVLIHSATGGVGLACIEILKAMGFNSLLFVTVGSKEKEQFLRNTYGSFITGIYSTRDSNYATEIRNKISEIRSIKNKSSSIFQDLSLGEHGVDVIINTLPVEFMESNFNTLSQGGRIVDLSITHLNTNETVDYSKFRYIIGYLTTEILSSGFKKVKPFFETIINMIKEEKLNLIPIKEYPVSEIKEAIEYLGERKHIGKVVVNFESTQDLIQDIIAESNNEFEKNYLIPSPNYQINSDVVGKSILFTGQKGLSLTIIKFILLNSQQQIDSNRIKNIIIFSKSPIKFELQILIQQVKSNNIPVNFYFKQVDVSNMEEIQKAIDQLYSENSNLEPIESIFHNAFIPVQAEVDEVNLQHLIDANGAKIFGFMNLYQVVASRGWLLKKFIIASSVSSILGGHRQCGYVCANAVIDSFTKVLRQFGLPCVSINFSPIASSGYVSRNPGAEELFSSQGLNSLSSNQVLGSLDLILQNSDKLNNKIIAQFNYSNIGKTYKDNLNLYKLDFFLNSIKSKFGNNFENDDELSIRDQIVSKFSEYLSIDESKLNFDLPLSAYGINSLLIVEIKNWLDKTYVPNILTIAQLQQVTINQLIVSVKNAVYKSSNNKTIIKKSNTSTQSNTTINWENEIKLNQDFIPPTVNQINIFKQSISNTDISILLTGATGFFGIYILSNLIKSSNIKFVYCLTRSSTKEDSLAAIIQLLKDHQLFKSLTQDQLNKIEPVLGDYSKDLFGMSKEDYSLLSSKVNIILNSAADTNLKKKYLEMKDSLEGVYQCLKFSCHGKLKRFIQISTLGIYSNSPNTQTNDDYYFPPYDNKSMEGITMTGYNQSKLVAEYRIKEAASKGVPAMIIRCPPLFPNPETGIGRPFDLLQVLLQSIYLMDVYPVELQFSTLYASPITWSSKVISFMISNCWNQNSLDNLICFNLFSEQLLLGDILQSLSKDLTWRPISSLQFIKKLTIYENDSCRLLASFVSNQQDFLKHIVIPGKYSLNQNLRSQLESNGLYEGGEVTKQSIITHLNYTFKKKIL